jgi:hypothetical protein
LDESDYEFKVRVSARNKRINAHNLQKRQEWADKVKERLQQLDYKVDPLTFRNIQRALPGRQYDIIQEQMKSGIISPEIKHIVKNLKYDLSNIETIQQEIKEYVKEKEVTLVQDLVKSLRQLDITMDDGSIKSIVDFVSEDQEGEFTLQELIDNVPEILEQNPEFAEYV